MIINRDTYLNKLKDSMHNTMIKVITGPRRVGKTYLLFELFYNHLKENGVPDDHIIRISLDDITSITLRDPLVLNDYISSKIVDNNEYYILIDELQFAITPDELKRLNQRSEREDRFIEAPLIYYVLNGLMKKNNVDVYVTGSNSKFLSRDVLTEFRGRGYEIRVYPLSFNEYFSVSTCDKYSALNDYMLYGGMPFLVNLKTEEEKTRYLDSLIKETIMKDIMSRYPISKKEDFYTLLNILASSVSTFVSPERISKTFKSKDISKISPSTISKYMEYLKDAFVISTSERYSVKGRKYIGSPQKVYFDDLGLRNTLLNFRQVELPHLMENVIYNELLYRGWKVDCGVVDSRKKAEDNHLLRNQKEVDFVINSGYKRMYIQSSFALPDENKIRQEKSPLMEIKDNFEKIIIVGDNSPQYRDDDGILYLSIYDFLLNKSSIII